LNLNHHQTEGFAPLPFDRVAQRSSPHQPFRYYQTKPHPAIRSGPAIVEVKMLAAHYPPSGHNGGKFFRTMQALLGAK
jgi:hypothetical protein